MAGHSRPKDGVASLAYVSRHPRPLPSNTAIMEMPATGAGMTDSI
jgi:hypothetical protein